MINKLKNIKLTKRGIYISLAVCMLVIGGIGIFSAVKNMNKIIEETDFVYEELPPLDNTLSSTLLDSTKNKEDSEPVINEEVVALNFVLPVVGEITKEHSGSDLVYSETMNDYRTHSGIDITSSDGATVLSAESGEIVRVENHPLWGTTVEVEHKNGFSTCYRNLSDSLPQGIEVGSYVSSGGVIGTVGSTALVEIGENPHLHFEMSVNGTPVNPLDHISFS